MKRPPNTPIVIGLTGSIGMGKSTVARQLGLLGWPVHDSDAIVHALLGPDGAAVKKVAKLFPEALKGNAIDRKKVGQSVFGQPAKLKQLEAILHPLVQKQEARTLAMAKKTKARAVVLDIPLLFETGADKRCDVTLCVSAPAAVQRERVLARKGMTPEKFRAILKHQMSDRDKRARADFVIRTDKGLADTYRQLKKIWPLIEEKSRK